MTNWESIKTAGSLEDYLKLFGTACNIELKLDKDVKKLLLDYDLSKYEELFGELEEA